MSTTYLLTGAAGNANLDNVFDPYVSGTSPSATGFLNDSGTDIATLFAPLSLGTAAAATSLLISSGADLNTLFAAKGTVTTSTPIAMDGQSYLSSSQVSSGSITASQAVGFTSSTWTVTQSYNYSHTGTYLTGPVPSGATSVQCSVSVTSNTGLTTNTNGCASYTTLSGTSVTGPSISATGNATNPNSYIGLSVTINFKNSGGTVISTSTCSFSASGAKVA